MIRARFAAEKSFPKGYDQMLGRRFEDGLDLSTGQWQKIALARAYMGESQILILDEPSASLDAQAQHEVFPLSAISLRKDERTRLTPTFKRTYRRPYPLFSRRPCV